VAAAGLPTLETLDNPDAPGVKTDRRARRDINHTSIPVGASLLAKTTYQSTSWVPDTALSRAGSLPQGLGIIMVAIPILLSRDRA
jgi:hypothetical protein